MSRKGEKAKIIEVADKSYKTLNVFVSCMFRKAKQKLNMIKRKGKHTKILRSIYRSRIY